MLPFPFANIRRFKTNISKLSIHPSKFIIFASGVPWIMTSITVNNRSKAVLLGGCSVSVMVVNDKEYCTLSASEVLEARCWAIRGSLAIWLFVSVVGYRALPWRWQFDYDNVVWIKGILFRTIAVWFKSLF